MLLPLYSCARRPYQRGFTLVELMIVVAIIAVLAALAIYGVAKYLAVSKSAEAKTNVGAIARSAVEQYTREHDPSAVLAIGTSSTPVTHVLCTSATPVPNNAVNVSGRKYQPSNNPGEDFGIGSRSAGWPCLGFGISNAVYYRYQYLAGSGYLSAGMLGAPTIPATGFEASAQGDLDGDGALSTFAVGGAVEGDGVRVSTQIYINNETE